MQMAAERLVAVQLIIRHGQVGVTDPNVGALAAARSPIVAGSLGQIDGRDLRRADPPAVHFRHRKYRPHRRLHLVALLRHFFLKLLQVINADHLKTGLFADAEQQYAAAVLIGEAGQRIIQPLGTVGMSGLAFQRLRFCPLFADRFH